MSPRRDAAADAPHGVRLDVWLWAARFCKTRVLARQAIETGKVAANGERVAKPSRMAKVGDALRIERAGEQFEVTIVGLSAVRGPATVAQTLYVESEASRAARAEARARMSAERAGYRAPESKPDKRARRLIRALGDIDAL